MIDFLNKKQKKALASVTIVFFFSLVIVVRLDFLLDWSQTQVDKTAAWAKRECLTSIPSVVSWYIRIGVQFLSRRKVPFKSFRGKDQSLAVRNRTEMLVRPVKCK